MSAAARSVESTTPLVAMPRGPDDGSTERPYNLDVAAHLT
jgi:hypothetical protein